MKYQFTPIYDKISSDTDSYHKQIRKLKKEKADELLKELNYREAKTLSESGRINPELSDMKKLALNQLKDDEN